MTYPFSYYLFKRAPIAPVFLCMILMIVFSGSYVLISYQTGFLNKVLTSAIPSIEFRANFTVMLLMGYLPMAQYFLIKWSQEHRQSLVKLTHSLPSFNFRLSRFWGLVGIFIQFWFFSVNHGLMVMYLI